MSTAKTLEVYVDGEEVVIDDRDDLQPGRVHHRVVQMAWHRANQSDTERATVGGRTYHRDALRAALNLLEGLTCGNCGEPGAVHPNPNGGETPWCRTCVGHHAAMTEPVED